MIIHNIKFFSNKDAIKYMIETNRNYQLLLGVYENDEDETNGIGCYLKREDNKICVDYFIVKFISKNEYEEEHETLLKNTKEGENDVILDQYIDEIKKGYYLDKSFEDYVDEIDDDDIFYPDYSSTRAYFDNDDVFDSEDYDYISFFSNNDDISKEKLDEIVDKYKIDFLGNEKLFHDLYKYNNKLIKDVYENNI